MHIHLRRSPDGHAMLAADTRGNDVRIYLPEAAGGDTSGFRPMSLMIASLGGCSVIDVLVILKKQRQRVDDIRLDIEAERVDAPMPNGWEKAHLAFTIIGRVDRHKAEKAVAMSVEKYCSASETLRLAGTTITWGVQVEDRE